MWVVPVIVPLVLRTAGVCLAIATAFSFAGKSHLWDRSIHGQRSAINRTVNQWQRAQQTSALCIALRWLGTGKRWIQTKTVQEKFR
jgi:hypothetical protein